MLGRSISQAGRVSVLTLANVVVGDRPFTCEICGKSFSESMTLTQVSEHTQRLEHLAPTFRPYSPALNRTELTLGWACWQHMRVHTQEKPYVCTFDGCGKAFALASALTIHMRE
jgi:uncharacterized Zn-finger protein